MGQRQEEGVCFRRGDQEPSVRTWELSRDLNGDGNCRAKKVPGRSNVSVRALRPSSFWVGRAMEG